MTFSVDVLTADAQLRRLEPEWRLLWEHAPASTPFQSPDWLLPWWTHFQADKELRAITVRRAGALVGILPLYLTTHGGTRELLFIGTGNSDHLDLMGEPGSEDAAAAAAVDGLAELGDSWDVVDLQELDGRSALLRLSPPSGLQVEVTQQSVCPMVELSSEGPVSLSARLRSNLAQARRKIRARGSLRRLDLGSPPDPSLRSALIDGLIGLHQARWQKSGAKPASCTIPSPAPFTARSSSDSTGRDSCGSSGWRSARMVPTAPWPASSTGSLEAP